MTGSPIIKKIPGNPIRFQHEKDGYVCLSNKTKTELQELLEREEKLLNNKKFIERLPDKGEKVRYFKYQIQCALEKQEKKENLCDLLASLNVNESKKMLNGLEWTGSYKNKKNISENKDDSNSLTILAAHSGIDISKQKCIKTEKSEPVTKSLDDAIESNTIDEKLNVDIEFFAKELCHRVDNITDQERKKRFYAHRSLNKPFVKSFKHIEPEISSAYYPTKTFAKAKQLSLEESMMIYQQQMKKLKEIELYHAIGKLNERTHIKLEVPRGTFDDYREPENNDTDDTDCASSEDSDN